MSDDQPDREEEGELPPPIEPATGPAADPGAQQIKRARGELKQRESDRFWRAVLADPVGRAEIWGLLQSSSAFVERHAAGPTGFPDPMATDYYRGQRDFGLNLYFKLAAIDRAAILLMHGEHDDARFPKPPLQRRKGRS